MLLFNFRDLWDKTLYKSKKILRFYLKTRSLFVWKFRNYWWPQYIKLEVAALWTQTLFGSLASRIYDEKEEEAKGNPNHKMSFCNWKKTSASDTVAKFSNMLNFHSWPTKNFILQAHICNKKTVREERAFAGNFCFYERWKLIAPFILHRNEQNFKFRSLVVSASLKPKPISDSQNKCTHSSI